MKFILGLQSLSTSAPATVAKAMHNFRILTLDQRVFVALLLFATGFLCVRNLRADVPKGSAASALAYYKSLAKTLEFSTPDQISNTTLTDVANYLGYNGLTGADLQNLPSSVLMHPEDLPSSSGSTTPPSGLEQLQTTLSSGPIPFRADDILVTRFFAPKIMNIGLPEASRPLGWRKLVRLRARVGSLAEKHQIAYGIILFNIFTQPGSAPFSSTDESINTQVMLVTEEKGVPKPNVDGPATIYWLDYFPLSKGGILSPALNATFDANELPQPSNGTQSYFVPDGCVACHGNNSQRSMVNYLDTDHWFDRLDNDFPALKATGTPLLFDAKSNNPDDTSFKSALDVIRRFNEEANQQATVAQQRSDERLAVQKWLDAHFANNNHVPPVDRSIGSNPTWSDQNPNDIKVLNALNQFCFRCHGSVDFSVFNRQELLKPTLRAEIEQAIRKDAPVGVKMPPDRELPDDVRSLIHDFVTNPKS